MFYFATIIVLWIFSFLNDSTGKSKYTLTWCLFMLFFVKILKQMSNLWKNVRIILYPSLVQCWKPYLSVCIDSQSDLMNDAEHFVLLIIHHQNLRHWWLELEAEAGWRSPGDMRYWTQIKEQKIVQFYYWVAKKVKTTFSVSWQWSSAVQTLYPH